jgi:hypothetical protein
MREHRGARATGGRPAPAFVDRQRPPAGAVGVGLASPAFERMTLA